MLLLFVELKINNVTILYHLQAQMVCKAENYAIYNIYNPTFLFVCLIFYVLFFVCHSLIMLLMVCRLFYILPVTIMKHINYSKMLNCLRKLFHK